MEETNIVDIAEQQGTTVVSFKVASISNAEQIEAVGKSVKAYIGKNKPKRMVVDFEGVKFFSSQLLGLLLDIRVRMETGNGELVISAINPQLYRVFKITNLKKVFEFFPDRRSAIIGKSND